VAPGESWFRLERTVPAGSAGPPPKTRTRTTGPRVTSADAELFLARSLRLADDFSDPASGWSSGQDANATYGYLDGSYRIRTHLPGLARWASPPASPRLEDLALELDAWMPVEAPGGLGPVFGLDDDGSDYHLFSVFRSGHFGLYRWAGGAWQTLVQPRPAPELAAGGATNHLLLVRDRGLTRLYANGRMITMVTDVVAPTGRAGLYASGEAAGFEARFDHYRLYDLP
jgi:hypothetical protein